MKKIPVIDSLQIKQLADRWATTIAAKSNFREAPSTDVKVDTALSANTPLLVKGVAGNWLRVELPEGIEGFLHQSLVKVIPGAVNEFAAKEKKIIRIKPSANAPAKGLVDKNKTIIVYNKYNSWQLVQKENEFGWITTV